ncbi:hypothetical protein DFR67_11642 [Williamsia limnetica]|uniref:Uncharacterized protein n=1 Tax=Williamsia limnetica TaxID=882452 RepID=A0A318RIQ1_WILLI|nr:hypothetical protein [Williamsia limnetica]PYE13488.1 hypothetical protein DFR67_11642 [Williamsia limnetica]
MTQSDDWNTAETAVAEGAQALRAARTHREIRAWADTAGVTTKALWPKVKTEMRKQLDIDYDQIRDQTTAAEAAELATAASAAPVIELCSAGDGEVGTYAVCAADNDHESWYGEFHAKDMIYRVGDDLSAERSAADKAIFLAGKAREKAGLDSVRLILHTSHHDLTAQDLAATASRHRVAVTVELSDQNPAIALCRAPGYRTWREIKLDALLPAS